MVSKLPAVSNKFNKSSVAKFYNNANSKNSFSFTRVSQDTVMKILKNIDITKSAGIDNLSGRFIKDGAEILASPIAQLCNLSIATSWFPDCCKTAKLKPLFKRKGSKTDPKNYRPISLLPLISKIMEKVIHDQTESFLSEKKVLYNFQSGFRKNHSTDSCLSFLNDKILKGFDSGLYTGMILIDLQKAFDTINHTILLEKMSFMGFSEQAIMWFKSYLTNRTFKVIIDKTLSSDGTLACGVPQGSILGPLLFLLYVNDMPQAVSCDLYLYADDSCLVYQHKDVKVIEQQLNKDFSNLCDWFVDNKLSIHFGEDKTKSILFSTKNKVKRAGSLNIKYNNIEIKQHTKVTYLGCILDETLSGESMALHVINKVNSKLKFLYRNNRIFSRPLRRLLCNALIQPHFDFACCAWYPNLNKNLKNKLQTAQNKCIRFCLQLGNRSHIGYRDFQQINWLNIESRFYQCASVSVFNFFNGKSPSYMSDIYNPAGENVIDTRNSYLKLKQPFRKTNIGQGSLSFIGPSVWNKLPTVIKQCKSVNSFKHEMKSFYFEEIRKKNEDF